MGDFDNNIYKLNLCWYIVGDNWEIVDFGDNYRRTAGILFKSIERSQRGNGTVM
jgi:hypothetical protein